MTTTVPGLGLIAVGTAAARDFQAFGRSLPGSLVAAVVYEARQGGGGVHGAVETASRAFGSDADRARWRILIDAELRQHGTMLWATAAAEAVPLEGLDRFSQLLVVADRAETALPALLRRLVGVSPAVVVLLTGERTDDGSTRARTNHVLIHSLAESRDVDLVLSCDGRLAAHEMDAVAGLLTSREPGSEPRGPLSPRIRALPSHRGLPELWRLAAVRLALERVMIEEPEEAESMESAEESLRGAKLEVDPYADESFRDALQQMFAEALGRVDPDKPVPLSEQLRRQLEGPVQQVRDTVHRLLHHESKLVNSLSARSAHGLTRTQKELRRLRDRSSRTDLSEFASLYARTLLEGKTPVDASAKERLGLAMAPAPWAELFEGLPALSAQAKEETGPLIASIARDQLALLVSELPLAVATGFATLARHASQCLSSETLLAMEELSGRVDWVLEQLDRHQATLERAVLESCIDAFRSDRLVQWAVGSPTELRAWVEASVKGSEDFEAAVEACRRTLSGRCVGMIPDKDLPSYAASLEKELSTILRKAKAPSQEHLVARLVKERAVGSLREALAGDALSGVSLHAPAALVAQLGDVLRADGLGVHAHDEDGVRVSYWAHSAALSRAAADRGRGALTEHRMSDLLLRTPEGPPPHDALGRVAADVVACLVLGCAKMKQDPGFPLFELSLGELDLPPHAWFPYAGLLALMRDPNLRLRLEKSLGEVVARIGIDERADEFVLQLAALVDPSVHVPWLDTLGLPGTKEASAAFRARLLELEQRVLCELAETLPPAAFLSLLHDRPARLDAPEAPIDTGVSR